MNKNALLLVSILADGRFHSGENLAKQLGVSRTAIWKSIKQLESYGLAVKAVRGKGYCLSDGIELLSETSIRNNLSTSLKNRPDIEILFSTSSTNSYLLARLEDEQLHSHIVIAETQTSGRGRRGNKWLSPIAGGIYFSVAWHFNLPFRDLSLLSLYIGVAIARSLSSLKVKGVGLKWPNDVVIGHKKLGGVLIDLRGEADGPVDAVIGIGINYKHSEYIANKIDQEVTDINCHSQHYLSRNEIIASLLTHLFNVINEIELNNKNKLINEWREYDCFVNESAKLVLDDSIINGKVKGVDDQGSLLILVGSVVKKFTSGELSLRKQA